MLHLRQHELQCDSSRGARSSSQNYPLLLSKSSEVIIIPFIGSAAMSVGKLYWGGI